MRRLTISNIFSAIKGGIYNICRPIGFVFNKAENFHYLALTLAIIVGGVWTLYTFDVLNKKENAVQELEKTEKELKELQDKIDGTNSSYIQIQSQQFDFKEGKFGLIVNVLVQNTGTNDVDMTWDKSPLRIYKVESRKGDQQKLYNELIPQIYDGFDSSGNKTALQNLYLFVGAKKELSFFVELEKQGLYYVRFLAETNGSVSNKMNELKKNGVWFSSKYIYVEKSKSPEMETYIRASNLFAK